MSGNNRDQKKLYAQVSALRESRDAYDLTTGHGASNFVQDSLITAQGDYEDRWFLEIDRSTESLARLTKKAQGYINYFRSGREQMALDVFPRVLWVVPDHRRASQLVGIFAKLPAEDWKLFQITATDGFARVIASGAGETGEAEL